MSYQFLAMEANLRDIAKLVTLVFGCLVLLGGLMGYVIAKSVPSLIMGGLFGLALIGVWAAGQQGWKLEPEAGAALAAVLLAFFGLRFLKKKKFMPTGLLAIFSLIVLGVKVAAIVADKR
jgi:uncharacterized membrane protein (UPF0136 family)